MYSLLSAQFVRGIHKKTPNSLRIHRIKSSQHESDGATTSSNFHFGVAKRICEENKDRLDELNTRIVSQRGERIHNFLDNKHRIDTHINNLKRSLEKGGRHLIPIGSYANGLFGDSSDIDLVLMPYDNEEGCLEFQKKFQASESYRRLFMVAVKSKAMDHSRIRKFHLIFNARVPILKLVLADGTDMDIQFNNANTIGSSLYIKSCVHADPRVGALIGWLKDSLTRAGMKNQSMFSTYHCVFLVLHFLRNKRLDLEVLPPHDAFDLEAALNWKKAAELLMLNESIVSTDFHSNCRLTPAELVMYMCDYYTHIGLNQISLNIDGDVAKRATDKPFMFNSPFFKGPETECKVLCAPLILMNHYESVLKLAQEGMFSLV